MWLEAIILRNTLWDPIFNYHTLPPGIVSVIEQTGCKKNILFFFFAMLLSLLGILVPWSGVELGLRQWKRQVLTTGPPGNSQKQGSPTSRSQTGTSSYIRGSIRLEIKCTINVMSLNHPQTIPPHPPWSMEKLSSMKSVPDAKNLGNGCPQTFFI